MPNDTSSNITRKLLRVFMQSFDSSRVLTKAINSQLFAGKFTDRSGTIVDVKRPHDYRTSRTVDGDLTNETKSDIISGKASAVVQDYFTAATEWGNLEEATELDQLKQILDPMATRIITDLEIDLGVYMARNAGLHYGDPGTPIANWGDVSGAGSLMKTLGVPQDKEWKHVLNPFSAESLASEQYGLAPPAGELVQSAWERSTISSNLGGMRVMTSNALPSRNITTAADLVGALSATPNLTYLGAKDTMTQLWSVSGLSATATIQAGDIIEVTGKYRCGLSTRRPVFNAAGEQILFSATVVEDVTLVGGAGDIVVTGPAIWEDPGQYNTTTSALASGDVITILGTSGEAVQPGLFFHPDAFTIATVKLPKLYSTDTVAVTRDGFSIRCSKYSDGDKNKQMVRFDLLPAFGTLNPFFAGQSFGKA